MFAVCWCMSIAKALSVFTTLACEKRGCLENTVNTVVFDIKGKKQGKHAFRGTKDLAKDLDKRHWYV